MALSIYESLDPDCPAERRFIGHVTDGRFCTYVQGSTPDTVRARACAWTNAQAARAEKTRLAALRSAAMLRQYRAESKASCRSPRPAPPVSPLFLADGGRQ